MLSTSAHNESHVISVFDRVSHRQLRPQTARTKRCPRFCLKRRTSQEELERRWDEQITRVLDADDERKKREGKELAPPGKSFLVESPQKVMYVIVMLVFMIGAGLPVWDQVLDAREHPYQLRAHPSRACKGGVEFEGWATEVFKGIHLPKGLGVAFECHDVGVYTDYHLLNKIDPEQKVPALRFFHEDLGREPSWLYKQRLSERDFEGLVRKSLLGNRSSGFTLDGRHIYVSFVYDAEGTLGEAKEATFRSSSILLQSEGEDESQDTGTGTLSQDLTIKCVQNQNLVKVTIPLIMYSLMTQADRPSALQDILAVQAKISSRPWSIDECMDLVIRGGDMGASSSGATESPPPPPT